MQASPVQAGQQIAQGAEQRAHAAARQNQRWLVLLGRFGYAAAGLVYGLVAVLAFQAAVGSGGNTTDSQGALRYILEAPFGRLALAATTVGLVGYAVWRLMQATLDTDQHGSDAKGWVARAGILGAGVIYAVLALSAANLVLGRGGTQNGDQAAQDQTAWLMSLPFGRWLVAAAGLVVMGVGLAQFVRAFNGSFQKRLRTDRMGSAERVWVERVARGGLTARGVVFGIIGVFLVTAGLRAEPGEARGLGGVLATLAGQPYGPWLLGLTALGLLAYALFLFAQARYRRMVIT